MKPVYVTWDDEKGRERAFSGMARGLARAAPVVRSAGSSLYFNIAPNNVSVRDGFGRSDYEHFRPDSAVSGNPKDLMARCNQAYWSFPVIKNAIDLMSDFAVQGLEVCHPNPQVEKFYREWWRRVQGPERSERFLNYFYRMGMVMPRRHVARLSASDEERLRRTQGEADESVPEDLSLGRREVPIRYSFINPLSVDLVNEDIATFVGAQAFRFALRLPPALVRSIVSPRGKDDQERISTLPKDILDAVRSGSRSLLLPTNRVCAFYYKRDDWQAWPIPMLAPLLRPLQALEKLQLADLAALDGAISSIRVWKLGNLDAKILPSEDQILRLAEMLTNNVGGGVMDLIWGPDIELIETKTDAHHFLGEGKYVPTLKTIHQGLGLPGLLSGDGASGGFTANYLSLKTLIERLEYGRSILRSFWEEEARIVQRAMRFRFPPLWTFDRLLTDEAAEKQLLLNMADRDLISIETFQEMVGLCPEIEEVRMRREMRRRKRGMLPTKASPFHDANLPQGLAKIFASTGAYAPSEFGVELAPRKEDESPPVAAGPQPQQESGQRGQPGQGRPRFRKDSKKRKRRTVKPRRSATLLKDLAMADEALQTVARLVTPAYLESLNKKSLRELTHEESSRFEDFKFAVLCQHQVGQRPDRESVGRAMASPLVVPTWAWSVLARAVSQYAAERGREPSTEALRQLQAGAFVLYRRGQDEEAGGGGDGVSSLPRTEAEPATTA
jgi:hypothetical protein